MMKVYIVNTGELYNDINGTFVGTVRGTKDDPNPDTVWYSCPSYCVLIDHPAAGWILYDIGTAPEYNELLPVSATQWCYHVPVQGATMVEQLALLGLTPKDIRHVVISHMHTDHIGNIHLFEDTAEFYVSQAEAEYAFTTVMASTDPEEHSRSCYIRQDVLAPMHRLHYIEEDGPLFPGVEAVMLPGHTPGLVGLLLQLEEQPVLVVSDALNGKRSYDGQLPNLIYDSIGWRKSLEKVKRLERERGAVVWFGHDMDQFRSFRAIPEFYE